MIGRVLYMAGYRMMWLPTSIIVRHVRGPDIEVWNFKRALRIVRGEATEQPDPPRAA